MQNGSGLNNIHPVLWKYVRKNLNRRQNRKATNMELTTQYYHDFAVISCKYCSCKYRCFGASNCSLCLCGLLNMILTRFYKVFFSRGAFKQLTTPNQSWTWICKENLGYKAWKTPNNNWSFFSLWFYGKKKFPVKLFVFLLSICWVLRDFFH